MSSWTKEELEYYRHVTGQCGCPYATVDVDNMQMQIDRLEAEVASMKGDVAAPTGMPRKSSPITDRCVEACKTDKYHAYGCPNDRDLVIRPTGTGEGSAEEWAKQIYAILNLGGHVKLPNTTIALLAERLDAYATALRSQLAEAQRRNKHLQIELEDEYVADVQIQEQYEAMGRDLATAQARLARLEQALRQVNHLQHSLAIEQEATGNMRIEYWTREIEDVVVEALNPAEPQSGEKGAS